MGVCLGNRAYPAARPVGSVVICRHSCVVVLDVRRDRRRNIEEGVHRWLRCAKSKWRADGLGWDSEAGIPLADVLSVNRTSTHPSGLYTYVRMLQCIWDATG